MCESCETVSAYVEGSLAHIKMAYDDACTNQETSTSNPNDTNESD